MRWPGRWRKARWSQSSIARPAMPGSRPSPNASPIAAMDLDGLVAFAREERIDFVVIGPEAPLVAGLADRLEAAGIKALGPSAAGAALEGSKGFVKDLCAANGIPTAAYGRFGDPSAAKAYAAEPAPAGRDQGRRAGGRQRRHHRRDPRRRRGGHRLRCSKAASAKPDRTSWSRNSSRARKPASSCSATATTCCRWPAPRTTSAPMTATRARTPAAWAPTARPRC